METAFPKFATKEELSAFTSPALLIAAENDVFFPAKQVVPRATKIFSNLEKIITIENASHFQNIRNLDFIINEIKRFFNK
jgi:pimeloyl-ACP methyl ester carboxylesterase